MVAKVWTAPPTWPPAPPGWSPPAAGWSPSIEWPEPPPDWVWWQPVPPRRAQRILFATLLLCSELALLVVTGAEIRLTYGLRRYLAKPEEFVPFYLHRAELRSAAWLIAFAVLAAAALWGTAFRPTARGFLARNAAMGLALVVVFCDLTLPGAYGHIIAARPLKPSRASFLTPVWLAAIASASIALMLHALRRHPRAER